MNKYINDQTLEVAYISKTERVGDYLPLGFRLMTAEEVDRHENPVKYLSATEKARLNRESMSNLTPVEFDIKLNSLGLYDAVQELIKDSFDLRIAYTRATFFSRTDPFIDQARIALGLTDEQVDAMWVS